MYINQVIRETEGYHHRYPCNRTVINHEGRQARVVDNSAITTILNEGIVPNEISRTSRGPVKAACGPGPRDVRDIS